MGRYQEGPEGDVTTSRGDVVVIRHDVKKEITHLDWNTHEAWGLYGHWLVSMQNEDAYTRFDGSDLRSEDLLIYLGDGCFEVYSWQSDYPNGPAMHWFTEMDNIRLVQRVCNALGEALPGNPKLANVPVRYTGR